MNLQYKLDKITSPEECQWVRRQSAVSAGQSPGPLVLSFASCQKAQTAAGQVAVKESSHGTDLDGGLFTHTINVLLQTLTEHDRMGGVSIRYLFDKMGNRDKLKTGKQDLMITSNYKEIDLRKITFPDLVSGSISGEDGSIQPKYLIGSGVPNTTRMMDEIGDEYDVPVLP